MIAGRGGWVIVQQEGVVYRIRLARGEEGKLAVTAVYVEVDQEPGADNRLTSEQLRAIPVRTAEFLVAALPADEQAALLAPDAKVEAALDLFFEKSGTKSWQTHGREILSRIFLRLDVPPVRRKPDGFYEAVASAYIRAGARSNHPAVAIAEANSVPTMTVHRWIKEARRRGFLPPGTPGRVG